MEILLLTPQPPLPAHQGTALRNWGLLRHLAGHHAITLITFAPPDGSALPSELSQTCQAVELVPRPSRGLGARLRTAASGQADLATRLASLDFELALRRVLRAARFDLAQVEGLELGRYLATLRETAPAVPIVYDAHNAEVTIQERAWRGDRNIPNRWAAAAYSRLQIGRLGRFEAEVCRRADAVTCVSEVDAAAIRRIAPGVEPTVVANGIDLADYPLSVVEPTAPPILTFTGKMDYRPNVDAALWFASEIMPRIGAEWPDARFEVVGQNPSADVARLNGQRGIHVLGAVPDIRPYIDRGAVYVAPLRMGGGTRFKLLEAMARGRPLVSTTVGAEGFRVQSGREMLIADTPDEFARSVLRLLDDAGLARQIGLAGRAFVQGAYDWAAIIPRLEAVQKQIVDRARRLTVSD